MQWNEGFEWAPFGLLWIKSLHCLWMTTMNLWRATDAGYADTKTSRNICHNVRVLCWKNMTKEQFSSFMDVTLFHRFQTVISMAKSKHYNLQTNHRFVFRSFYCLFSLFWLYLKLKKSTVEELLCFYWKFLIKHHLFISVSIPNVDIFQFSSL